MTMSGTAPGFNAFIHELSELKGKLEYKVDDTIFMARHTVNEPILDPYAYLDEPHLRQSLPADMQGSSDEQLLYEDWKKIFGEMTPKQLVAHFAKLGNPSLALKLTREGDAKLRLTILPDGDTTSPAPNNQLKFLLSKPATMADTSEIQAHFAYAKIEPDMQGQRTIRQYMTNAMELLRTLGAQRCTVNTEKVGGYAWAKFGFVPATENEWKDLKEDLQRRLMLSGKVVLSGRQHHALLPEEVTVIKNIMKTPLAKLHTAFPQLAELNRVLSHDEDDHAITVGKALLIGTTWHGALPLRDHHCSYERFKAYTDCGNERKVAP